MKKLFKGLVCFLLVVVIIVGIPAFPVVKNGYNLYKTALAETPLEDKVYEIKATKNYTDYRDISQIFTDKLVEEEDRRFFSHSGFDLISFTRAVFANIATGTKSQGGSTLTQQLAKNMYFSFEKSYSRKVAELLVAWDLEKAYSKEEILSLYCSLAYFGQNCYGVKRAANYYYNIDPIDLNEAQSVQLVETLKAPSIHNPSTMNGTNTRR